MSERQRIARTSPLDAVVQKQVARLVYVFELFEDIFVGVSFCLWRIRAFKESADVANGRVCAHSR